MIEKQSSSNNIFSSGATKVEGGEHKKNLSSTAKNKDNSKLNTNRIPIIPNDLCENITFSSASICDATIEDDKPTIKTSALNNMNNLFPKLTTHTESLQDPILQFQSQFECQSPIKQEYPLKMENTYNSNEEMIIKEEQEPDCDNDYERNDCFIRLKSEEWNTSYYTLLTIASSLMYHDRNKASDDYGLALTNPKLHTSIINFALVLVTISVILFIISSVNRYLILLQLNKSTSKISRNTTFWNIHYFSAFLVECVLALFHPNIFCKGIFFTTSKGWYLKEVTYEVNDFLVLITIFRVYVFFRLVFSISTYYSSRSARIAQLIGTKLTRVFAMKSLVVVYPFYFLSFAGLFIVVMLSFMLKVIEGQAFDEAKGGIDYRPITNCLWNILVTMTTVGYGDYYPMTNFGRLVNVLASISGSCLISLLTLSLQNALIFQDYEANAFQTRQKEQMRQDIEKTAGSYFKSSFQYLQARKKFRNVRMIGSIKSNESNREINRKEMESALYDKIEKKRKFKDAIQFFRNIYEIPNETDTLKVKMEEFQEELNLMKVQSKEFKNLLNEINTLVMKDKCNNEYISKISSSDSRNLLN